MITWTLDPHAGCCQGAITDNETGRTLPVQTDWDFPGVARSFGWATEFVQCCPECDVVHLSPEDIHTHGFPVEWRCPNCGRENTTPCPHETTDGTVDCDCGMTASDFISLAREWLDAHHGETAEDPGYFT